ncbi:MAG: M56 family metallopeptidase [Chloroherpetonaceae bacterium]
MIETLNQIGEAWCETMLLATLQNALFLCLLLIVLFILRKKDARTLRLLALLGLLKLFLPPMNLLPESAMPATLNLASVVGVREIVVWGVEPLATKSESLSMQAVLFVSWLLGSVALFSIAVWKTVRLKKQFEHAKPIETSLLAEVPKGVSVVQSESVHSPFVYGIWRPTIVLPKSFSAWGVPMQSAVLAHEVAHLCQYDHYLALLQTLAKAMHFFNPIVFFFFKRLDDLREMCCDDEATKATSLSKADYANALIAVATHEERGDLTGAIAFSEQFNSLKQRITYQLSKKEDFKMKHLALTLSAIVMVALSLNCAEEKQSDATLNTQAAKSASEPPDFMNVEKDPEFINRATAKYPEIAKQHGVEARVIVKALIGEDGLPKKALVVKYNAKDTSNSPERQAFEQAAIEATLASTFSPAEIGGKKLSTWLMIPYNFKLNTEGVLTVYAAKRVGEGTVYVVKFGMSKPMRLKAALYNDKGELVTVLSDKIWTPSASRDGKSTELFEMKLDMKPYPKGRYEVKLEREGSGSMVTTTFEYK